MIFEIRNYHYDPAQFDAYLHWAENHAIPVLSEAFDVVGFWVESGEDTEVTGSAPMDTPIGHANVTWIIRWDSKAARDEGWDKLRATQQWKAVGAAHPDPNGYRQIEIRYARNIG
tara:strand:- start:196 stop:540 length:345 start_codon:yes stop_codon:yes gene_type:complete